QRTALDRFGPEPERDAVLPHSRAGGGYSRLDFRRRYGLLSAGFSGDQLLFVARIFAGDLVFSGTDHAPGHPVESPLQCTDPRPAQASTRPILIVSALPRGLGAA